MPGPLPDCASCVADPSPTAAMERDHAPPSPSPPDISRTRRVGGRLAVLAASPQPALRCPCAASLAVAASCTLARVCISFSLVLATPSCAPISTPPPRLQRCKSFEVSAVLIAFAAAPSEPPQPRRLPVTSHRFSPCPAERACGLPAADRAAPAAGALAWQGMVSRARGAHGVPERGVRQRGAARGGRADTNAGTA